jgi:hypothetical protein
MGNLAKAPGDCMGLKLADLALALRDCFDEIPIGKSSSERPQIKVDFD